MKPILVVGHRPPPITGENLCLLYLEQEIERLGKPIKRGKRLDFSNLFLFNRKIWLVPGAKRIGHVRDFALLVWWLIWRNRIRLYVHNISWSYFQKTSCFWKLIGGKRLRFVVLTDHIADTLRAKGLVCERLNNTLTQGGEPLVAADYNPFRLVWLSALTLEKGFDVACSIFQQLVINDPRWIFDVYGDGSAKVVLESCPQARFHGFIQGHAKTEALRLGGIMLLPSRYRNETQPLVLIEAMSHGLPIVASQAGGIGVMIGSGPDAAGVSLQSDSQQEVWLNAVRTVHERYHEYSCAARKRYASDFSRAAFSRKLSEILD
jgi:glycosyltransferase involved in cell wall biosynthesis